ncbi:MAG: alpha-glucosidase [Deltaproteobacteria bacterium]|nr:alpha-glucosidase [Deltaproteobacteria bacterium]
MRRALIIVVPGLLLAGCGGGTAGPTDAGDGGDGATDAGPRMCGEGPLPGFVGRPAPNVLRAACDGVSVEVAVFADGVARLRYLPAGATALQRPWSVVQSLAAATELRSGGDRDSSGATLCTPELAVHLDARCHVIVSDAAGRTLVDDGADGGWSRSADVTTLARRAPPGVHYYGFGERNGALDRRGRRLTFWNTDAYDSSQGGYRPDQDPLYQSIPFYLALDGAVAHGVFTDVTHRLEIDVAAARADRIDVSTRADGTIDQYVFAGPSLAEVVRRYTALTGRTPQPPRWALGFHQSRWGYGSAAEFEAIAAELRRRELPADGLWLDIQHLDGYRTFTFDPQNFPAPEAMLARLAAQGFHTTVIVDPGIKVDPDWPVYQDGVAGRHFLETAAGAPFVGTAWPGASVFPDFTRPETRTFWGQHIGALVRRGVAGIWLDVNEPTTFPEGGGGTSIPDDVIARGDAQTTMAEVHNIYANLEAEATVAALRQAAPGQRPFVLTRAGYAGIQRHAAVWTGDAPSTFATLANQLPMLLGMGLSGVPFVGSDVGGYSGHASPELYARWMALGTVSPFFRAHVTSGVPGQEPWQFGPEVEDISRALTRQRYRLLPYLESLLADAASTGAPPLRPMLWEFQADARFVNTGDQAMLGPSLLLAPVVDAAATSRSVVLPAGRWFDYQSDAVYDGPATLTLPVTLAALPMLVRAGAVLPTRPFAATTTATAAGPLSWQIYPVAAGTSVMSDLAEDAGDGALTPARRRITVTRLGDRTRITVEALGGEYAPPARMLQLRLHRVDHAPTAALLDGVPISFSHDARDLSVEVEVADRPTFTVEVVGDDSLLAPAPPVAMEVRIELPAGTPMTTPVTLASDAWGWTHMPLVRSSATLATGTVSIPRGTWFHYKVTRGDWATVEKGAGCVEMTNRYRLAASSTVISDTVATWRDICGF